MHNDHFHNALWQHCTISKLTMNCGNTMHCAQCGNRLHNVHSHRAHYANRCTPLHCSYILFCVHFQTNSSLVWKKNQILTTCFPNQFQFGLEKNYNFDDSFSKPIPVWFGKNDHFLETKNSKLIPRFFGKTLKIYIFFLFPNLKLSFALKCQGTDAKSDCLMLSLVTLWDYGLMITTVSYTHLTLPTILLV